MNENLILKANILGGMDCYARDNFDDDLLEVWLAYGIPDECDEDILMEIAEVDTYFEEICNVFAKLVKRYVASL